MNSPRFFLTVPRGCPLKKSGEEKNLCEFFQWLVCNKYFPEEMFDHPCWITVSVPMQRSNNQIPLDLGIIIPWYVVV